MIVGLLILFGTVLAFAVLIALLVFIIVGQWKMYDKAGVAGIFSLIPFYNNYCLMCRISKLHWGYFVVYLFSSFISAINSIISLMYFLMTSSTQFSFSIINWITVVVSILVNVAVFYNLSLKFKKSTLWVVLTILFSFITLPLLGLSKKNIYYYNVDAPKGGLYFSK